MKRIIAVIGMTMLIVAGSWAQDSQLIPCRKGKLWGYCNEQGGVIIPHKYERTWFFSPEGIARIKNNGLYGFIDTRGRMVVVPRYGYASDYRLGLAQVRSNDRTFCINLEGKEEPCEESEDTPDLLPDESTSPFRIVEAGKNRYRLIIAQSGDTVPESFDNIRIIKRTTFPSTMHFAVVSKKNNWGAYDAFGVEIAPMRFRKLDVIDLRYYKGMIGKHWGVNNFMGETIVPFRYDSITRVPASEFSEHHRKRSDHFIVSKDGKFGVVDDHQQTIIPLEYDAITIPEPCACETEYVVRKGDETGLIDSSGKLVLPIKYDHVEPFRGSAITIVKAKGGVDGYVGRNGTEYFSE